LAVDDPPPTGWVRARPASRACSSNSKLIFSNQVVVPPIIEIALHGGNGGNSFGSIRHWQPVRARYKIASTRARNSVSRGRPKRLKSLNSFSVSL